MTREAVVVDRLDLLRELESLALDILVIEARDGTSLELEDYRRRVLTVRATVVDQLRGLLAVQTETVH